MTDATEHRPAAKMRCRSCEAEIDRNDRFCRTCGAVLPAAGGQPSALFKKIGRGVAALMFLSGLAIVLFALLHGHWADIILVIAFAIPLCGAGAMAWRTR